MTSNDRKMDRALASLDPVTPQRSVWPDIESALKRYRRGKLWRRWFGGSAIAASIMVTGVMAFQWQPVNSVAGDLQKTIDTAIRDAMPTARFIGLEYDKKEPGLSALLVSTQPRGELRAVPIGSVLNDEQAISRQPESHINKPNSQVERAIDEF